jgi:hypothetical protein
VPEFSTTTFFTIFVELTQQKLFHIVPEFSTTTFFTIFVELTQQIIFWERDSTPFCPQVTSMLLKQQPTP